MKTRMGFLVLAIFLTTALEVPASHANGDAAEPAASRGVIHLQKSRRWALRTGQRVCEGYLAQELTRQAILVAARDELGLITRDAWLGDPMPAEGGNTPLEVAAIAGSPSQLEILRGLHPEQEVIARLDLSLPGELSYLALLVEMEKRTRGELLEALMAVGFSGTPNALESEAEVPEHLEELLAEMTFPAQFSAVRQLHELIRTRGESPELLGALVRAYANLGVNTEFLWHRAHKVFKARALLYAQRMVARYPESAWPKWHRAYAFALVGIHKHAIADLATARRAWEERGKADGLEKPSWVDLIDAHCRYDLGALDPDRTRFPLRQLAHLLGFSSTEWADDRNLAATKALAALEEMPECYRILDGLCHYGGVATSHRSTMAGLITAGQTLYDRLDAMPGLPDSVRRVYDQQGSDADPSATPLGQGTSPFAEEFETRGKLIAALLRSDEPAGNRRGPKPDAGDPSWATLGLLLRELSFLQAWRRADFQVFDLAVSADEFLAVSKPLYADHPYAVYLSAYAWDPGRRKEALEQLGKLSFEGSEVHWRMFSDMGKHNLDAAKPIILAAIRHADPTPGDKRWVSLWLPTKARIPHMRALLDASPYSPYARAILVESDWENVAQQAADWEKDASDHPNLLTSLGYRYYADQRPADAERCLKKAIQLDPDPNRYMILANIYKQRGDLDTWLATLEEYLARPDYGLGHATARKQIATHFMARKQWKEAEPYAVAAAESYAQWALECAAHCYEGLQDWDRAEAYYRAIATRYEGAGLGWYAFCRRTGHGDAAAAREAMSGVIEQVAASEQPHLLFGTACYCLLFPDLQKARELLERAYAISGTPIYGLFLALVHDQLNDLQSRDEALKRLATWPALESAQAKDSSEKKLVQLGQMMADDLAAGGKGEIDLAAFERLRDAVDERRRGYLDYALAKYLALRGKPDIATKYWKRCMAYTAVMDEVTRTLAGAELAAIGVLPDQYREVFQPEGGKNQEEGP